MSVAPQVTSVPEGLRAAVQTISVSLRLSGELPTLRGLSPAAVRLTVNASGLSEGIHVLEPSVSVPDGIEVIARDPEQVVVVLRR